MLNNKHTYFTIIAKEVFHSHCFMFHCTHFHVSWSLFASVSYRDMWQSDNVCDSKVRTETSEEPLDGSAG